jgi:hypothetical protein
MAKQISQIVTFVPHPRAKLKTDDFKMPILTTIFASVEGGRKSS